MSKPMIEQKNGSVIRRLMGYERYSGVVAGQAIAQLYAAARWSVNYLQPSFRLLDKTREGTRVKRRYDTPQTPCALVIGTSRDPQSAKQQLTEHWTPLPYCNASETHNSHSMPWCQTISTKGRVVKTWPSFSRACHTYGSQGEARPTHEPKPRPKRHWRTRPDDFASVWPEVLEWLEQEPELEAAELLTRLKAKYPEPFRDNQKRTLQRRMKQWRSIFAHQLVFGPSSVSEKVSIQAVGRDIVSLSDGNISG